MQLLQQLRGGRRITEWKIIFYLLSGMILITLLYFHETAFVRNSIHWAQLATAVCSVRCLF